ncbi:MAG TPA: flagellar FlbD family protein [Syntrophothermus lipocalidus]|uniref:Flagellar FlbD family protein n=1 Tax=Syntrophothermus lipocalidus (strain DSM 12680 / TGB-C1) TaxID=643648 RepID=D7CM07_SYNLT|nr:flagellar FlbD family protein [Syntrophothermus lipocalidus]ADI01742.1 flagellar FlbD family protein [Syntrophothermus lipocalidus DSM 12680]HHV77140.1 flagellar FlbD family protein [Syntrophothermus lipocalidus]HOV43056.1 flagellar FlbD family protein [Syntrophothermus lipocalidus]
MLRLTRLNGEKIILNPEMVEYLEETPDTVITLTTGKKLVVRESVSRISEEMIRYKRRIFANLKL